MGRRNKRDSYSPPPDASEFERTLAAAEEERAQETKGAGADDTTCPCGSREFLMEAFLAVVDGRAQPEPVDVESLTCPQCGREFEAVPLEGGRYARGEFRGWTDVSDE